MSPKKRNVKIICSLGSLGIAFYTFTDPHMQKQKINSTKLADRFQSKRSERADWDLDRAEIMGSWSFTLALTPGSYGPIS